MYKRIMAIVLLLTLTLSGCSGGAAQSSPAQSSPAVSQSQAESEPALPAEPEAEPLPEPAPAPESVPQPEPEPVPEPEPEPVPVPQPVAVTAPLDLSGYQPQNDGITIPDLLYWANGAAEYEKKPTQNSDNIWVYRYEVNGSVAAEFIDMLQTIGFTMVDSYSISGNGDTLASWGFTCDAMPHASTHGLIFTDTPCHVSIWTSDDDEYRMDVSPDLTVGDTGARRGGGRTDLTPQGPSAGAGLILLPDGSYQTSDGRLTASVGTAAVLRDGQSYTAQATLITEDDKESLWVEDYYRNEGFYFESPESYLMTNDLFQAKDLSRERSYDTDKDSQDAYNWGGCYFSLCHNGEWVTPLYNEKNYETLTVRVMYNEKGGDRVYYVYARFLRGEPTEVEALVAVSADNRTGALDQARYLTVGETASIKCDWNEFGSKYHVYKWSVAEGSNNVVLDPGHNTCEVSAIRPGVAVVTVRYEYTQEGRDVLLNTPTDVPKSKTQEYVFVIQ